MGNMNEVIEMEQAQSQSTETAAPAAQKVALQPAHQVATNAFELVAHAAARGASMEELKAFIELQERLEANDARKAYVAAMAEFKRNPPQIVKDKLVGYKNKDGSFTGYKHATLGSVCAAVVEGLGIHGFSHRWDTEQPPSGLIAVTCVITHAMGHSEATRMEGPPDNSGKKNIIQQVASTITYLQRYTLLAATGLATNDELDDDGGGGEQQPQPEATTPAKGLAPTQASTDLVEQAKSAAAKGIATYQKFWSETGASNRKMLAAYHDSWKAQAAAVDLARTVDTETVAGTAAPLSENLQALLADFTAVAEEGLDVFNAAWDRLSKATQDSLYGEYPALKARAEAVGAAQ